MVPMLISTLHAETGYLACMTELRHASVIAQGASWNGTVVEPLIKDIPNKAEYNNLYTSIQRTLFVVPNACLHTIHS